MNYHERNKIVLYTPTNGKNYSEYQKTEKNSVLQK